MGYANIYFGKDINAISYEDVEKFFLEPKDESDKIEYKSYHSQSNNKPNEEEKGVLRSIAGLLNSEGGLVIWGAPKGKEVEGKKEKVFEGALCPVDKRYERDSFMTKIADSITPSPKGIRFQPLEKEGKFVYVIEVEQSMYAPHQYQNIYYMRIDGQTRPAPHHYVEALFKKISFPRLEGYLKYFDYNTFDGIQDGVKVTFELYIFNESIYQNEYEVYYKISTTGFFNQKIDKRVYTDNSITSHNAKSILFYHDPFIQREEVKFAKSSLSRSDYKGYIFFSFGGKQSPIKVSTYIFDFKEYFVNEGNDDAFSLIKIERDENLFGHEFDLKNREKILLSSIDMPKNPL